jgi:hypothetical protein
MPVCKPGSEWAEDTLNEKGMEMMREAGLETGNIIFNLLRAGRSLH